MLDLGVRSSPYFRQDIVFEYQSLFGKVDYGRSLVFEFNQLRFLLVVANKVLRLRNIGLGALECLEQALVAFSHLCLLLLDELLIQRPSYSITRVNFMIYPCLNSFAIFNFFYFLLQKFVFLFNSPV